jgi:hypothetical protein
VTISKGAAESLDFVGRIDGIGNAWYGPVESFAGAALRLVKDVSGVSVP